MAKTKADHEAVAQPIAVDLTSDRVVLEYLGGPVPSGIPARDLNGSDLGRQAYIEALAELDHEAPGFERPVATSEGAAQVAAALVAGGSFAVPRETSTPQAAPAAEPEA